MSQFIYRGSPTTQSVSVSSVTSSSPPPSILPSSGSTMAVTSTIPPGARSTSPIHRSSPLSSNPASSSQPPASRCCDTGRPLFTDPLTGQTVCSCQYDLLNYQRLAASGMGPGAVPLSMYSAPYTDAAAGMAAYFPALGGDQAPFYTNPAGLELKENLAAGGAPWPYPSVYHPYDTAFAGYPFNGYGMDLNGARRKNATRETTSTLKAWLNEHKKNPYPTKGEKIMLAIITKMTLTQVSTWFANARRRLKKENKMTWEPRNRVEDDDNNNDDDDHKSTDGKDILDSKDSGTGSSEDGDRPPHHRLDLLERPPGLDNTSEWSESRADSGPDSPDILFDRTQHLLHPAYHLQHPQRLPNPTTSPPPTASSGTSSTGNKPRIWSLADMASKESEGTSTPVTNSAFYSTASKLVSPLANRSLHSLHSPYVRPEFYRNFYNPASGPENMSLLESYSRTFGASLANNGINPLLKPSGSGFSLNGANPLGIPSAGLTTTASGVSPSSSTSSLSEQLPANVETKQIAVNKA